MSVMGVDPGTGGALAMYDANTGSLNVVDMPTWRMPVGKKVRSRVDAVDLIELFEIAKMGGCKLVVIEAVGGRPRQSASAGFVFGYTVGLIYMACIAVRLPIETISPQIWKKVMRIPGKREGAIATKEKSDAIINRADEIFPEYRALWRGPQGGYKLDRAEAAMIAKYGAEHTLHSVRPDAEWRLAYRNANTGA